MGVAALEAHINAIAEELLVRVDLSILDQSILEERDFRLEKGEFALVAGLRMYRLEDRLQFLFRRFTKTASPRTAHWWPHLQAGLDLRNKIVHPKTHPRITDAAVQNTLQAVLDALDALYSGVFKKGLPGYKRGLNSSMTF